MEGIAETWRTQRSHFEPFWLSEPLRPQSTHPVAMRFVRLHGNAQHYWNDRVLDANDWFGKKFNNPRPFDVANQGRARSEDPLRRIRSSFSSIQIQYSAKRYPWVCKAGIQPGARPRNLSRASYAPVLKATYSCARSSADWTEVHWSSTY